MGDEIEALVVDSRYGMEPILSQPPAPLINAPLEGALDTVDRQGSYSHTSLIPKLRTFRNMENV
ncbi:hypothetical protein QFZ70_001655 [Arthrobacter sp. V1I9]|uniref:hypothetical protein n=1 Tax=Arthrobacter sp. V1I9 TaxID=3042275 RepID=UPI002791CCED|nr:hypothetical protein [Arthrobacter sp. V1I9]MDQ0869182.1 hypothetical protein [Arthrobacter sp. V1I9]